MKNLNKLGLILGVGGMSALVFSLAACGEDPPAASGGTGGTGGTGGSTAGAGGNKAGAGGSTAGSSSGSGGSAAGAAGKAGAGGGGAGGAGGGGAGGGGAGGSSGSGGGGAGGGGGAPSAACKMLCEGASSIVTVCAAEAGIDANLKVTGTCLQRCANEPDAAKVKCWQDHTNNYKVMQGDHCKHAGGEDVCTEWPAP